MVQCECFYFGRFNVDSKFLQMVYAYEKLIKYICMIIEYIRSFKKEILTLK